MGVLCLVSESGMTHVHDVSFHSFFSLSNRDQICSFVLITPQLFKNSRKKAVRLIPAGCGIDFQAISPV